MKRIIKYFLIVFILLINLKCVNALSVSKNDLTMEKGANDSVELYANTEAEVTQVNFTLVFSTYDISANFVVNPAFTDGNPNGIAHSINLGEAKSGQILLGTVYINTKAYPNDTAGTISIHSASAKTASGEVVNLNAQNINVRIGTATEPTTTAPKKDVDKNMLEKIESKIVKIELKKDIFEYDIIINDDVEELDLKPVAKDTDTKVEITTQKISEIKDNKIIITTKKDGVEQKYTINITVKEKPSTTEIVVDKSEFKADTSYKGKWIAVIVVLALSLAASLIFIKKK